MKKTLFSVLSAALVGVCCPAHAVQTDNYGLHAVPAPGAVAIDGKLNDWDLSGEVLMTYDIETLRDVYSGRVATMYDANNLYISIHWKDPVPMGNSHDPRYTANKGWAGDAVQMRIKTDRISHITAWYYAAKQEPAMVIDYGQSLTKPFGGGSIQPFQTQGWKMTGGIEMAFQKDADGKGYVQEMALPWKVITNEKPYRAGDNLSMGFELLWGEADWPVHRYADNLQPGSSSREFFWTAYNSWGNVALEPHGNLKLPERPYMAAYRHATAGETPVGPVDIAYNLPKDARVSLAIDDVSGKRVRNLIAALPRKAGRNTEKWDGLDDNGKAAPPGNYTFKTLYHDGIHTSYVMSFANPGSPSWDAPGGRGAFYGDHTAPQAAAAAGNYVALACPMGEAGKHLIGTDLNGQRLWGLNNRVAFDGGQISLATDGKLLWIATEGKKSILYRVDIATGKYAPWQAKTKDAAGNEFDLLELPASELPGMIVDKATKLPPNVRGIAYHEKTLAVALWRENSIKLIDAQTGATQKQYTVPAPQAIVYTPQGQLIVLSQGRLLRVAEDGTTTPFGTLTFADGYGLTCDAGGKVYLSVRGEEQNVKVFSPQGELLGEIGRRGGRPIVGAYDAAGMRNPAGIAVDSQGHLWVTEETMNPKRTSVWDTATGKLWKDLPGTTTYAGAGAVDPFDTSLGFSDNTVYRLNLQTGTSQPVYSLGSEGTASLGQTATGADNLFPPVVHSLTSKVVKRGPLTYIYTGGAAAGSSETHVTLYDGKAFRSVAHLGLVPPAANRQGAYAKYGHPFFAGQEGKNYAWADANGDGVVQREELCFGSPLVNGQAVSTRSYYWGQLPDDEGTVITLATGADKQLMKDTLLKFRITGTNAVGAPLYDIVNPQVVKVALPVLGSGNGEGMLIGGSEGRVYVNQDPILAIDRDGKVLGSYPSHFTSVHGSHQAKAARSGYIIGPSSFLGTADMGGEVGEVAYLNGNLGENYLFTSDGLFIQALFKDTRGYFDTPVQAVRGESMDATTAGGESFGGNFIKALDGKTYLTLGATDARVMEVSGLNTIKRVNGKFTYTAAQFAEAQRLVQQQAVQAQTPKVFTIAKLAGPVTVDGKADEWPELLDDTKALLEIQESTQQRYARASARYDADNLYLGYRVFAPSGAIRNAGQDERLLFKSGDAVDLMIGPEKSATGAGNARILLSKMGGQPVAIVNQKVAPDAAPTEKFDFASPWRTITFDRVVRSRQISVGSGPIRDGYFVEAVIPWKVLGIAPHSGLKLRGDVGVLFADNGGATTVSRQYWSNKATGLVNDVPGEADLTPGLWGTLVLE